MIRRTCRLVVFFILCVPGCAIYAQSLTEVAWDKSSFWGRRQEACRSGSLPVMTRIMQGTEHSHFLENFKIAAGLATGRHRGPAWNDGDTYKWLEAMIAMQAMSPSSEAQSTIDDAIELIAKAQRADGYIHTPVLIANLQQQREGQPLSQPFGDPVDFEMYNFGHLMTAACLHYQVTGKRTLLDVAIKAADFLERAFSQPDLQLSRHAICPSHYMGIVELYRATGETRYLDLAERWLKMRDAITGGGDDNQDRVPLADQREAVGHAVRANYLYAGLADLMLERSDARYQETLISCWKSVQNQKIYITGGCGALFDGASPDGSKDQKQITRVHQAYGRNYQLPNSTAHNETCAAIGYVLWNYRMWQLTGRGEFIDALENSLMNAVLSGVSLDGERFFYTNTLRQLQSMPTQLRWSRSRQEWISCYCCPPNVARTIARVQQYAYATKGKRTSVLLYGSNHYQTKLDDQELLEIEQRSDYPLSGSVQLVLKSVPDRKHQIACRLPAWCQTYELKINGKQISAQIDSGFAILDRHWQIGDRISIELAMPVRPMTAHPLIEECRGQLAVMRGPLVYCVESQDLPHSTSVQNVAITPTQTWEVSSREDVLQGAPVLKGKLLIESTKTVQARTEDQPLYSSYEKPTWEAVDAQLVPYYAWNNREPGEMSVWIFARP